MKSMEKVSMSVQTYRLKGIPRKDLKSRIAHKRVKTLWHFGPKETNPQRSSDPVELLVRRLRFS
jgi:hypothetical protein